MKQLSKIIKAYHSHPSSICACNHKFNFFVAQVQFGLFTKRSLIGVNAFQNFQKSKLQVKPLTQALQGNEITITHGIKSRHKINRLFVDQLSSLHLLTKVFERELTFRL